MPSRRFRDVRRPGPPSISRFTICSRSAPASPWLASSGCAASVSSPASRWESKRRYIAAGFRILKVKVGESCEADAALIRALREVLGPGVILRADGNQGYSEAQARRFIESLGPADLELLEQPVPASDLGAMARLARSFDLPIMADESIRSVAEAQRIADAGAADLINIKLMKSGGLSEALRIARLTDAAGLGAMVGCNDESRIGIAAGLHCALVGPNTDRADLDGHLDLEDDVARGGVRIEAGYILPLLDEPGLGVSVDF